MTTHYVLGAPDPEMERIESLLVSMDASVAHATIDGRRVHSGTAYSATGASVADIGGQPEVVLVECGGPGLDCCTACGQRASGRGDGLSIDNATTAGGLGPCGDTHRWPMGGAGGPVRIDHHRPGDPGHGRPAAEFLVASSVGQVIRHLAGSGSLPTDWERIDPCDGPMLAPVPAGRFLHLRQWRGWSGEHPYGIWIVASGGDDPNWVVIPYDLVLTAAADHCLAAAYRRECPGVDPDALMRWRVSTRSAHQGRRSEDVLADIRRAREFLRREIWVPGDHEHDEGGYLPFVDVRGKTPIPELPEAAALEGIPFLAEVPDPGGRRKVVLQAAPADLVRRFLAGQIVPGLVDLYGDPERGFAGGYVHIQ